MQKNKIFAKVKAYLNQKTAKQKNKYYLQLSLNIGILIFAWIYLFLRFKYVNDYAPIWYTLPWGDKQLASKNFLFMIPTLMILNTFVGLFFKNQVRKYFLRYGQPVIISIMTLVNSLLLLSLIRIIFIVSVPFPYIINPKYLELFVPFLVAFLAVYLISPYLIKFFEDKNIVTDPRKHSHPAMIRTKPAARGGGVIFFLGFAITSLLFVSPTPMMLGIIVASGLLAVMGLLDDIQNTQPKSKLRFLENPAIRLGILFSITLVLILAGIRISTVNNPFDGILELTAYSINLFGNQVQLISIFITLIWVVWVMNLLSWSNGIDGQYAGIVGIAGIVIVILALRFVPLETVHKDAATMAAILAGASFGMSIVTWSPAKIMWGFGATSAGVAIAGLSIIISGKIATSMIIIMIPFTDAFITFFRRILQGKNPMKGDKGHLHHILLERGWGIKKIAFFYWASTILFGIIAILSADKNIPLLIITIVGIVAFAIVVLNISYIRKQNLLKKVSIKE